MRNTALRDKSVEDLWVPGEVIEIDTSEPSTQKWTIQCMDSVRTVSLASGVTETEDLKPRTTVARWRLRICSIFLT